MQKVAGGLRQEVAPRGLPSREAQAGEPEPGGLLRLQIVHRLLQGDQGADSRIWHLALGKLADPRVRDDAA